MLNLIRKIFIKITRKRYYKARHVAAEEDAKELCEKNKDAWVPLTKEEQSKFKNEIYTFTVFKNLSKNFEKYKDYYVSDPFYTSNLSPRLNPLHHKASGAGYAALFNDKNAFDSIFKGFLFPKTIIRRINGQLMDADYKGISKEKALSLLNKYDKVIFKETLDSSCGNGIFPTTKDDFEKQLDALKSDFIVQEQIRQHSFLANFNSSSVNVIRIFTLNWKGHVYVLDSRLRIGAPGSFCDHLGFGDVGPLEIKVDDDGSLIGKPFCEDEGKFVDDIFGVPATGKIPNYDKMLEFVINGHTLYPQMGFIGWDMTVDEDGNPMCIEANTSSPFIFASQCVSDPLFAKKSVDGRPLLDEILETPIPYEKMRVL